MIHLSGSVEKPFIHTACSASDHVVITERNKVVSVKKFDVELGALEHLALLNNFTITSMCESCLRSPKKSGEFVWLRMIRYELEDLVGWVAAESNHEKTNQEEYLLESAFESLESALFRIR